MKRLASILLLIFFTLLVVCGVSYFFIRQQALSVSPPTNQSVLIGVGWNTYHIPFLNFEVYYPAQLIIGNTAKKNTPQLFYIWLPMGGIYGFSNK